jgi:hypothetical protein
MLHFLQVNSVYFYVQMLNTKVLPNQEGGTLPGHTQAGQAGLPVGITGHHS